MIHVLTARRVMTGTKYPVRRSATRSIGALRVWPARTTLMIWSSLIVRGLEKSLAFRTSHSHSLTADGIDPNVDDPRLVDRTDEYFIPNLLLDQF